MNTVPDYRTIILQVIDEMKPGPGFDPGRLHVETVLREVKARAGIKDNLSIEKQVLAEFYGLFSSGLMVWGKDLGDPTAPYFHISDRGVHCLGSGSRDPGNASKYKAYVSNSVKLSPIAMSYLEEGVDCYNGGHFKAAAVLVGGAAEAMVVELRDFILGTLKSLGQAPPKGIGDWQVKRVLDALQSFILARKSTLSREIGERFEAYWPAFTQQIRSVRNDVGHPSSVAPVTQETVHASLLIFPELAKLQNSLCEWASRGFA